jgi:hypothetical protein
MLVTLITIFILGGGSGLSGFIYDLGDVKKEIKTVVTDPDRQAGALEIIKDAKSSTKALGKSLKNFSKELDGKLDDPDLSAAELNTIWDGFMEEVAGYHEYFIDQRFELRDQLSKEEWNAIFSNLNAG